MKTSKKFGKFAGKVQMMAAAMALLLSSAAAASANVRVSPTSINFGTQAVGSASASRSVTVTNQSWRSLTITKIYDSASQFSFSGPALPITLNPGQSLTGSVTFKPTAAQTYTGTLQFVRSNSNNWGISISLSGTGSAPVSNSASAPSITSQPASAKITAGQTATFQVAATGTAPMTYQWKKNGTAVSGANASTYTTPAETTAAQFTVTVSNSAGSVTSNAATLTVTASSLILNSSVSSLNFGSVNVSSSGTKTVTLTNAGNSAVTISNVTVSGAGFSATGMSGVIVNPGQSATLTTTFTPSAAGAATGTVSVASNASNSPDSISLSGTGVAAVAHSVDLSWTSSSSTVAGYNTYSSQTSGGPYVKMNASPVPVTSYTDSNVQTGKTYYFVVTSVDSNNVESAYSAEVSALIP